MPTHCQRQHKGVGGGEPSTGTMGHKLGGAFFGNAFARYLLGMLLQDRFLRMFLKDIFWEYFCKNPFENVFFKKSYGNFLEAFQDITRYL